MYLFYILIIVSTTSSPPSLVGRICKDMGAGGYQLLFFKAPFSKARLSWAAVICFWLAHPQRNGLPHLNCSPSLRILWFLKTQAFVYLEEQPLMAKLPSILSTNQNNILALSHLPLLQLPQFPSESSYLPRAVRYSIFENVIYFAWNTLHPSHFHS